jgi:hypothetical protein
VTWLTYNNNNKISEKKQNKHFSMIDRAPHHGAVARVLAKMGSQRIML